MSSETPTTTTIHVCSVCEMPVIQGTMISDQSWRHRLTGDPLCFNAIAVEYRPTTTAATTPTEGAPERIWIQKGGQYPTGRGFYYPHSVPESVEYVRADLATRATVTASEDVTQG